MSKDKITKIKIEKSPIRKPKKPRHLGSGFHKNNEDKRKNDKLQKELNDEE